MPVARERQDHITVDEAARVLGLSPARIRQMLRSGELAGERQASRVEGVLGSWKVDGRAVRSMRDRWAAVNAEETVVLAPEEPTGEEATAETLPLAARTLDTERGSVKGASDAPSDASEQLSEGVRVLREKAEALLEDLGRLEGRLEAAEIQESALREGMRREKERADGLEAKLQAEFSRRDERGGWRRLLGG